MGGARRAQCRSRVAGVLRAAVKLARMTRVMLGTSRASGRSWVEEDGERTQLELGVFRVAVVPLEPKSGTCTPVLQRAEVRRKKWEMSLED